MRDAQSSGGRNYPGTLQKVNKEVNKKNKKISVILNNI